MNKPPAADTGDPLLLTVNDVCRRLQLSRPIVYRLINAGELRSITIGRSRRVPLEALQEFITKPGWADPA